MHITHRLIRKFVGHHVHCHTQYGTFEGVIVTCTKQHIILAPMKKHRHPQPFVDDSEYGWDYRPFFPMGPGGPPPGGPSGPGWGGGGWGGGGGGGGGGWNLAIPLAAILGVTAIGLHW